ncbi:MAG: site-specific integrase, partial [Gammaproteobacteria bacterium]|nr:site-specific integrase [Gammaproteobacteria bacterium]
SKAWFYDFMHNKVRYRGVGGTTKTQALRTLEKKRSELLNGEHGLQVQAKNPLVQDFIKTYLSRREHLRSRARDELSASHIGNYFKGKRLIAIKPSDIEDYKSFRRSQGVKNATINRELACLKRMYSLAIKWGDAKTNPVKDVDFLEEPPGRTRYLSEEEAMTLIKACNAALKPIVITALNTGMRLQEILGLKWKNVHLDSSIEPYIEIEETKNNKKRFIPLNDDLVTLFESIRNNHPEYVFIGTRGKPLLSVKRPFATALTKAGITDFKFHDLRHTFASHFVMNGGDLLALKDILRHSSLKMVMRYAHLASAHKRKLMNNLSGKFSDCHPIATSEVKTKKAF